MAGIQPDFSNSRPFTDDIQSVGRVTAKTLPCNYVVIRGSSGQPERFTADSDEEAGIRLQKEVRAGLKPQIVYCYKLWCAEQFVPSSETLDQAALIAMLPQVAVQPPITAYSGKQWSYPAEQTDSTMPGHVKS